MRFDNRSDGSAARPRHHAARARRPLVVTADPDLLDDIARIATAAGVEIEVAPDLGAARGAWAGASLVLVGDDVCAAIGRAAHTPRRRPGVVVVSRDLDDAGIWQRAVEVGGEHVALLPDAEPWLAARLGGACAQARTVAVVGGRGGAGASVLAAALAVTAARQGRRVLLVDADPLGGGADLLFGGEDAAGLRWPDLAPSRGRIAGEALRAALPSVGELAVLSWDRGEPVDVGSETMLAVIEAARHACDLVVVDLPRRVDDAGEIVLARADLALLVVPAEVRAAAAAARVASALTRAASDVRLVVRGPAPGGLDASDLEAALGLPLAGGIDAEPDLAESLERGDVPAGRGVGPLAGLCEQLLDQLFDGRPASDQLFSEQLARGFRPDAEAGWLPGRPA